MTALFLYMGIATGSILSAKDTDAKLKELEARLDAIIQEKGYSIDAPAKAKESSAETSTNKGEGSSLNKIIEMYKQRKPQSFSLLKKYIAKHPNAPDIEQAKRLAVEWEEKKKTELLVHHKGHAGGEWRFYAFAVSADMEKRLKDIAELHWGVNRLNDKYTQVVQAVNIAKNNLEFNKAQDLINAAAQILKVSQENRSETNKLFENLLSGSNKPFYSTTLESEGMWLDGVNTELLFFIVETAGKGKYVRAWTGKAKGGSEITISGSNATVSTTE